MSKRAPGETLAKQGCSRIVGMANDGQSVSGAPYLPPEDEWSLK